VSLDDLGFSPAGAWLAVALLLGAAELVSPGVFLIFAALAAAITAAILLAVPDLPLVGQLVSFGLWSAVAVVVGRRWYHEAEADRGENLLNDRAARMLGEVVVVETAIEHGRGRVRIGDGVWLARGPEAAAGERVRVIAVDGAELVVERL
jgi:membrane protein implicated in regulation of membrane protease activity